MNMEYLRIAEGKVLNTQVLVNLVSYRTRQLNAGARPLVKKDHPEQDHHDLALKEIAEGLLVAEMQPVEMEQEAAAPGFEAPVLV